MATRFAICSRGCRCTRGNDGKRAPESYDSDIAAGTTYATVDEAVRVLKGLPSGYREDDGHGFGASIAYQTYEGGPWRWCWSLDVNRECPT